MVVAIPPIIVTNPAGISIFEAAKLFFYETVIKIGINMTTIGVLLRKALKNALINKVIRNVRLGCFDQWLVINFDSGFIAPVRSMPRPKTINELIAINA